MKKFFLSIACGLFCVAAISQGRAFKTYSETVPGTQYSFTMVPIPAGAFRMGSPPAEKKRSGDEGPQHDVSISAFWLGANEVTFDEFQAFLNDDSLSRNSDVDAVTRPTPQYIDFSLGMGKQGGFPMNSMSQHSALMYCHWLFIKTGTFYRLPTEAEWEYACRAGSASTYPYGDDSTKLGAYAWSRDNSDNKYHKTGEKKPNAWGLYDMLGNLAEWTIDQYQEDYFAKLPEKTTDPITEPISRYPKSVRGGGYATTRTEMRSAARFHSDKSWNRRDPQIPKSKWWLTDAPDVGFRIACPVKQPTAPEAETFYQKYLNN